MVVVKVYASESDIIRLIEKCWWKCVRDTGSALATCGFTANFCNQHLALWKYVTSSVMSTGTRTVRCTSATLSGAKVLCTSRTRHQALNPPETKLNWCKSLPNQIPGMGMHWPDKITCSWANKFKTRKIYQSHQFKTKQINLLRALAVHITIMYGHPSTPII